MLHRFIPRIEPESADTHIESLRLTVINMSQEFLSGEKRLPTTAFNLIISSKKAIPNMFRPFKEFVHITQKLHENTKVIFCIGRIKYMTSQHHADLKYGFNNS